MPSSRRGGAPKNQVEMPATSKLTVNAALARLVTLGLLLGLTNESLGLTGLPLLLQRCLPASTSRQQNKSEDLDLNRLLLALRGYP